MGTFPSFMFREENRIPASQQNTPDIEGYYYTAPDGSQMAFWIYKSDRVSKEHTHDYDEWMIVVEGEYLVTIDGKEHLLHAGDELFIPKGSVQGGRVKKGTRSIHVFGGQRITQYQTVHYSPEMFDDVCEFLTNSFSESGKTFDINGRHRDYRDIMGNFELFLCMTDNKRIIGTVAVKKLSDKDCELKALYLYRQYHGRKLGYELIRKAVDFAVKSGYDRMFLDTMSSYERAISLYKRIGFCETDRYNDNEKADMFMVLDLRGEPK